MVYACLADGCMEVFLVWGEARKHMRQCGCYEHGIPKLKQSLEKGHLLGTGFNHDPDDPFKGKLISVPPPTEDDLVSLLADYNRKCKDPLKFRKHASAQVRNAFGHFPFAAFGYGTLTEFLMKHGFDIPNFDKMAEKDKWMEDLEPGLVPCRLCRLGLPRDAFSKTQVQDWNRLGARTRPRCRNCLEAASSVRSGTGSPSVQDATCDLEWAHEGSGKAPYTWSQSSNNNNNSNNEQQKQQQQSWRQNWSQSCDEAKGSSWDDCEWDDPAWHQSKWVDYRTTNNNTRDDGVWSQTSIWQTSGWSKNDRG
ncbi:unnamed protein product [Polarella glacialis]|uniref:Uncharacterized protein n=1 Tax=Polarella glacialis TaxID=89957 RepID=A0A813F201_POLGL|nr:unnamed protein product [Polarella glacialis]CAE8637282.1 unnamed protein product [Polarella glacialis]